MYKAIIFIYVSLCLTNCHTGPESPLPFGVTLSRWVGWVNRWGRREKSLPNSSLSEGKLIKHPEEFWDIKRLVAIESLINMLAVLGEGHSFVKDKWEADKSEWELFIKPEC